MRYIDIYICILSAQKPCPLTPCKTFDQKDFTSSSKASRMTPDTIQYTPSHALPSEYVPASFVTQSTGVKDTLSLASEHEFQAPKSTTEINDSSLRVTIGPSSVSSATKTIPGDDRSTSAEPTVFPGRHGESRNWHDEKGAEALLKAQATELTSDQYGGQSRKARRQDHSRNG